MYLAYNENGTVVASSEDLDEVLALARTARDEGQAEWVDIRSDGDAPPREDIQMPKAWSWQEQHAMDMAGAFRSNVKPSAGRKHRGRRK